MDGDLTPIIHCTPPGDPAFLAFVSEAFQAASEQEVGRMALLFGTMARIRLGYPRASIIAVPLPTADGPPSLVWLVSRDGWAEIRAPELAPTAGRRPARAVPPA